MPRLNLFALPLNYSHFAAALRGLAGRLVNGLGSSVQRSHILISPLRILIRHALILICGLRILASHALNVICAIRISIRHRRNVISGIRILICHARNVVSAPLHKIRAVRNRLNPWQYRKRLLNKNFFTVFNFLITKHICADASPPL